MRKLLLDAFDYLRTGQVLPHCALCDSRYADAKPFVEGATGALVCHRCIDRLHEGSPEIGNMYRAAHAMMNRTSSDDPYRPPEDPSTYTCLLCGAPLEETWATSGRPNSCICAACYNASRDLLASQRDR